MGAMIVKQITDYSDLFITYMRLKDSKKPRQDHIFFPKGKRREVKDDGERGSWQLAVLS